MNQQQAGRCAKATKTYQTTIRMRTAASLVALVVVFVIAGVDPWAGNRVSGQGKSLDPAAWGSSHAGKPIPDFAGGDECLFCHRNDIGPAWQTSSHGATIGQRQDAPELAGLLRGVAALSSVEPEIEYFLGSRNRVRFLKKDGYGRFAILATQAKLNPDRGATRRAEQWLDLDRTGWDRERFANRCAGCHATAVDSKTRAFRAFGLDCFTCHGEVPPGHTENTSLVWLSKKRRSDIRAVTSLCAQCHLRGGRSRSTGLPYPNNFVAGDNLFQDYEVDFATADDPKLNAGDRHIWKNVRDVVLYGSEIPSCISCHQVHGGSSAKHRRAPRTALCAECHNPEGPLSVVKPFVVRNPVCEY
jgi:predicted CXXCH cytochrome family protein